MLIVLSLLVVTVFGKSGRLLKPMSQDMIDFINNEAQTTWKVCVGLASLTFKYDGDACAVVLSVSCHLL